MHGTAPLITCSHLKELHAHAMSKIASHIPAQHTVLPASADQAPALASRAGYLDGQWACVSAKSRADLSAQEIRTLEGAPAGAAGMPKDLFANATMRARGPLDPRFMRILNAAPAA